jgi:hypothetical protein
MREDAEPTPFMFYGNLTPIIIAPQYLTDEIPEILFDENGRPLAAESGP